VPRDKHLQNYSSVSEYASTIFKRFEDEVQLGNYFTFNPTIYIGIYFGTMPQILRGQTIAVVWWSVLLGRRACAFVDDVRLSQVVGPVVQLLPPLAESRGNLLRSGALVEVELELTLAAGYPLESLPQGGVPVQLGLWQHDELAASTTTPTTEGTSLPPKAQQQPLLNDASVAQLCGCSATEDSSKSSSHSGSGLLEYYKLAQRDADNSASTSGGNSLGQDCGAPYMLAPAALPAIPSRFITVYVGEGSKSSNSDSLNSSTIDGIVISSGGDSSSSSSSSSSESALMVRWNVTVNVDGLYHIGLVHCAPQALEASGVVRWTRGGTSRGMHSGGALPDEILGIVPFYGTLACAYFLLAIAWALRVRQYWDYTIALQLAVFSFLLFNLLYSALAFAYYLHLDLDTDLRADQVRKGRVFVHPFSVR